MQKFTGMQYLKMDIASSYGLDKAKWEERLDWFAEHEDHLHEMLATAETPALYYAGVKAYEKAVQGIPCGYPISLDATSSGLQLLAALTGDRRAAEICNVVNRWVQSVAERADAYTIIYGYMLDVVGEGAKIKRDDCKQAIMTSLYGSEREPREIFGEGPLLSAFYHVMAGAAPAAWELNQFFLKLWDAEALVNSWVLPDNFHVHVKVMTKVQETVHFLNEPIDTFREVNQAKESGRSLGANTIHSIDGMIVREMGRRCNYSPAVIERVKKALMGEGLSLASDEDDEMVMKLWKHYKDSGYLSARILDHLHPDNVDLVGNAEIRELIDSLPAKPFEVIAIHDCFRCLPNYGNDLREQYNRQLMLIAKSDLLSFVIGQHMRQSVAIPKLDPTMWQDIMSAEYALS